jgi:hypothetical protein
MGAFLGAGMVITSRTALAWDRLILKSGVSPALTLPARAKTPHWGVFDLSDHVVLSREPAPHAALHIPGI